WSFLQEIARQERIILAGGLNTENVGRAIHQLRPMAVDVSSG
ncbi:MAG TPA: N-(5'-phosphoribosyl)anthranilate isomerase, partial [Syntrophomonas wolfei]|nr:N-(5'-phosphoribosyl)anthranilate isomerase [Syntrophomonas wolfei]